MIVTERRNNVLYIQERVVQSNQAEQKEKKKKKQNQKLEKITLFFCFLRNSWEKMCEH